MKFILIMVSRPESGLGLHWMDCGSFTYMQSESENARQFFDKLRKVSLILFFLNIYNPNYHRIRVGQANERMDGNAFEISSTMIRYIPCVNEELTGTCGLAIPDCLPPIVTPQTRGEGRKVPHSISSPSWQNVNRAHLRTHWQAVMPWTIVLLWPESTKWVIAYRAQYAISNHTDLLISLQTHTRLMPSRFGCSLKSSP